jgi:hypothetical protein
MADSLKKASRLFETQSQLTPTGGRVRAAEDRVFGQSAGTEPNGTEMGEHTIPSYHTVLIETASSIFLWGAIGI